MNISNSMKALAAAMLVMTSVSSNAATQTQKTDCFNNPDLTGGHGSDGFNIQCLTPRIVVKGGGQIVYSAKAQRSVNRWNLTAFPWRDAIGTVRLKRHVKGGADETYFTNTFTGSYSRGTTNRSTNNQTFFLQLNTSRLDTSTDWVMISGTISTPDAP